MRSISGVDFIGDLHCIAVGLAVDVDKKRRLPIGGNDRVYGLHCGSDGSDVADAHRNASCCCLDDDVRDLLWCAHLAVDETQDELVIFLQQSRRIDQVGATNCFENVRHGDAGDKQLCGIRDDVELGFLPSLNDNRRNAVKPIQAWLDFVSRHLPQLGGLHGVGRKAITNDGETGEGHAMRFDLRRGRQLCLHARKCGVDILQRLEHVDIPVEEEVDLR